MMVCFINIYTCVSSEDASNFNCSLSCHVFIADWEALADREPSALLSAEELPQISKLSVEEEPKVEGPKRRGRGTFTYNKDVMYSESRFEDSGDNDMMSRGGSEKTDESLKGKVIAS